MAMPKNEFDARMKKVTGFLRQRNLDFAIVYFDEYHKANGRYLSDFWTQVEKGAIVVSSGGRAVMVGGPECGPYAKEMSVIKDVRSVAQFMVHGEEYPTSEITTISAIFDEIGGGKKPKAVGVVGYDRMPASIYHLIQEDLPDVELVDITYDFEKFRYVKSPYELKMITRSCGILDEAMKALGRKIHAGVPEHVAMAAVYQKVMALGAEGFDFWPILASGKRALTCLGRPTEKKLKKGEVVLTGLNCKYHGYAAALARPFIVDEKPKGEVKKYFDVGLEAHNRSIEKLRVGTIGKEIDLAAREFLAKYGYDKYHLYGSCHSIGLKEYEEPFFGPGCNVPLEENMTVAVDITLIGHPKIPGLRYEEVFVIKKSGPKPLSKYMRSVFGKKK